ncbi:hypothetical protein D3C72_1259770 [compost metagenome]
MPIGTKVIAASPNAPAIPNISTKNASDCCHSDTPASASPAASAPAAEVRNGPIRSLSAPTTGDISPVASMNTLPDQANCARPWPKCAARSTKYTW